MRSATDGQQRTGQERAVPALQPAVERREQSWHDRHQVVPAAVPFPLSVRKTLVKDLRRGPRPGRADRSVMAMSGKLVVSAKTG